MRGNRGKTSLKSRRRREDPIREFDRLPPELRTWLASAILPWRPRSALSAYQRARRRTRDANLALKELDRIQARLVGRDAFEIWGRDHPNARGEMRP
ncbi:MAG: DUF6525 family protein [Pseudomonadota bacterium]